jgi:rubrerythrin
MPHKKKMMEELLLQALETELGGVQVYETALRCITNEDLKGEFTKYHTQTQEHVQLLEDAFEQLGLDADKDTPGRKVTRHIGESLVEAMEQALEAGDPAAAQLVACECVVHAETKDHMNWELIGELAESLEGDEKQVLLSACEAVEEEEDEHLYHSKGWTRELWLDTLGLEAVLPPPEEEKDVKSELEAAKAKQSRRQLTKGKTKSKKPRAKSS